MMPAPAVSPKKPPLGDRRPSPAPPRGDGGAPGRELGAGRTPEDVHLDARTRANMSCADAAGARSMCRLEAF